MKTQFFIIYILILLTGLNWFYSELRIYFSGVEQYKEKAQIYARKLEQRDFQLELAESQLKEFQQDVAAVLPDKINQLGITKEASYPLRALASATMQQSSGKYKVIKAGQIFKNAKAAFQRNDFASSNAEFKRLIKYYSFYSNIVEAYFLLSEGQFQNGDLQECVETVEAMIEMFPESELTGYSMIRLGRIYEYQDRKEDALTIYKTVLSVFPQRDLASQASGSMRRISL